MSADRSDFLIAEYDQMMNDINRHIMVVWQSIGVLVGSFAFYALVEKNVISLDIATSMATLLCLWALCHIIDASYWYNRNLVIIANIERQFLEKEDIKLIQYYFGKHRPKNRMISHLKIQIALVIGIVLIVLPYHFITRVVPGFTAPWSNFDPVRCIPYVIAIAGIGFSLYLKNDRNKSYDEFITNSPGANIDASAARYGRGHGFKKGES